MTVKISVLLPVVDEWEKLERALRSIFDQNFEDYEIVIRVDGAAEVPEKELFKNPTIKWLSGERKGLAKSLNEMAKESSGELLMRLDADDEMLPGRMEAQYRIWHCGEDGLIIGRSEIVTPQGETFIKGQTHEGYWRFKMICVNEVVHSAVAMDAKKFFELGGYNEDWELAQDYELWCRWLKKFSVHLGETTVCRHYADVSQEKLYRQRSYVSHLVSENVANYGLKLSEESVENLTDLAGGMAELDRFEMFEESVSNYLCLLKSFTENREDQEDIMKLHEEHWPYVLSRNMASSKLPFFSRLRCVMTWPELLRAYPLKRLFL